MTSQTLPRPRPNATRDLAWETYSEVPNFTLRYRHLSRAALGDTYRVGVVIEELPPGMRSAPLHYHFLEEEHVYVLEGTPTLRLGDATHDLKPGDYVCFPAGQKVGHCLVNRSGAPCRYVLVGERNPNDVIIYPESNKMLVRALGRDAVFDLAARRDYWDGEDSGLPAGARPAPQPASLEAPVDPKLPISSSAVAWHEMPMERGFFDRNKHLTFEAVGEAYHVGVLIEGPPPGKRLAPRHYHMLEEEHALILDGEVTLLLDDERHVMRAGDYVCFPAGLKIGHSFLNSGAGPCSYLMIGERNPNDLQVFTDSGKMDVRALKAERTLFGMSDVRDYLDGEPAD